MHPPLLGFRSGGAYCGAFGHSFHPGDLIERWAGYGVGIEILGLDGDERVEGNFAIQAETAATLADVDGHGVVGEEMAGQIEAGHAYKYGGCFAGFAADWRRTEKSFAIGFDGHLFGGFKILKACGGSDGLGFTTAAQ
jgi:hypothetical protein